MSYAEAADNVVAVACRSSLRSGKCDTVESNRITLIAPCRMLGIWQLCVGMSVLYFAPSNMMYVHILG
jgi:hypothetical protein